MQLIFSVTKTYQVISPESAEVGCTEDEGFIFEDESLSFCELMRELKACIGISDSHVFRTTWAYTDGDIDYSNGHETMYAIHIKALNGRPMTAHNLTRLYRAARLIK